MTFFLLPFIEGATICLSLIIAIGIQNAFVLKQGILKNYSFLIAMLCSSIDTILIIIGVYGFGIFLSQHELLLLLFSWGGVIFIFGFSAIAFYSSFKTNTLNIDNQPKIANLKKVFINAILVSLNPNAILDTVILMGSISTQFPKEELFSFTLGASTASYFWFFTLSFAARFLRSFFVRPISWKILDFIIGCTMLSIGISLLSKFKLGI